MTGKNDWFIKYKENNNAKIRLFCFHHAGGSASVFKDWAEDTAEVSELVAIQLPGRENRYNEELIFDMDHLIDKLYLSFLMNLDKPYIFFGHSLGALIAFELARFLRRSGKPLPRHLVISAAKAPHLSRGENAIHKLENTAFIKKLMMYNGISQSIIEDKELLSIFLPMIRADFCISENYLYKPQSPLGCPITALGGRNDYTFPSGELLEWKDHTLDSFINHILEGDHFFIKPSYKDVINIINKIILEKYS